MINVHYDDRVIESNSYSSLPETITLKNTVSTK